MCKCDDGTAASGADCTTHDESICARCDAGFRLKSDKTACEGIGQNRFWPYHINYFAFMLTL